MPRRCSSGSRSVSLPVSARTSDVLPWSTCPAVPTVSVIERATFARASRLRATARATSSTSSSVERAAVEQEAPVADDADDRRLAERGAARRALSSTAHASSRELCERQRAAADPRDRLLDLAADEAREALGPGPDRSTRLVEHAQHRDLRAARARGRGERERPLERRERELVRAQRALQRVAAQSLDEVGAPDDDPRLRPAEQLVAREADEVGAGGEARRGGRLVPEIERATPEPRSSTSGSPAALRDPRELRESARLLGEADDAEVRLVDAQQQRRLGADRPLVVGGARAVRRPDLDEPRARAGEDVGDPEPVADLDQLAARDDAPRVPRRARRARAAPRRRCC